MSRSVKRRSFFSLSIYGIWILLLAPLTLFSQEDRANNPLYKALPPLNTTLEGLLSTEPENNHFIPTDFRESLEANWLPTEENFFKDSGVIAAENRFEKFCSESYPSDSQTEANIIPRVIHLIWMGSKPPETVKLAVASWEKYHPSWRVVLWTDDKIEKFQWSSTRSKRIFDQGKNWAEKSDILRFEILYQLGGIYADTDVVCLKSFDDLVESGVHFFAGFESNKIKRFGRPLIGSALIGAKKDSSTIKRCIEYTLSIEEAPSIHQHIRSGPGPISTASYETLDLEDENILLLPCSYIYPLPWEKRLASLEEIKENIRPESFALHLWEGSWFDSYHPPHTN